MSKEARARNHLERVAAKRREDLLFPYNPVRGTGDYTSETSETSDTPDSAVVAVER